MQNILAKSVKTRAAFSEDKKMLQNEAMHQKIGALIAA